CHPQQGSGCHPQQGSGCHSQQGSGCHPQQGSDCHPQQGSGCHPQQGSGCHPQQGSGCHPQQGSGCHPQQGSGCHPAGGALGPLQPKPFQDPLYPQCNLPASHRSSPGATPREAQCSWPGEVWALYLEEDERIQELVFEGQEGKAHAIDALQ
uniref:Uncharacterized protein n=1 Tax=Strigops habroptila TaxID=2489341 RepID=A0A672TH39_STRHB